MQILVVRADELANIGLPDRPERIEKPDGLDNWKQVHLLGGGVLIFDQFGRLKYHIHNAVLNAVKQTERLRHLQHAGFLHRAEGGTIDFAALHARGLRISEPRASEEPARWR